MMEAQKPSKEPSSFTPSEKMDRIINCVYNFYGVDPALKKIRCRQLLYTKPKHVSLYLIHRYLPASLKTIGNYFGMDHASVLHASKKIVGYLEYDKILQQEMNSIEARLVDEFQANKERFFLGKKFVDESGNVKYKTIVLTGFNPEELKEFLALNGLSENTQVQQTAQSYIIENSNNEKQKGETKKNEAGAKENNV